MAQQSISDEYLVDRTIQGDLDAFNQLYDKYVIRIYRFVAPRLPQCQAEDLTSVIMTTLWRNLSKFDKRSSFSTWAYSVANNALKNWYRKNRKITPVSLLEKLRFFSPMEVEPVEDDFEDLLTIRIDFCDAFKRLPHNYQSILLLRVVEGVPADETAVIMGLRNANAVTCMLYRAKELFRQLYKEPLTNDAVQLKVVKPDA